jgi:hypothetical protein
MIWASSPDAGVAGFGLELLYSPYTREHADQKSMKIEISKNAQTPFLKRQNMHLRTLYGWKWILKRHSVKMEHVFHIVYAEYKVIINMLEAGLMDVL